MAIAGPDASDLDTFGRGPGYVSCLSRRCIVGGGTIPLIRSTGSFEGDATYLSSRTILP